MDLRPIGTEVEFCYGPDPRSTRQEFVIWKYRISGHAQVGRFIGDEHPRWTETLEPISDRRFPVTEYRQWCGQLMPVPPDEALPFLDEGWRALAAMTRRDDTGGG